jgi:ribonuclease HIII
VADSKKLTSPKIAEIAATLHKKYPGHIAVVAPSVAKYNELYLKFANLNRLLAWGHARVIENLLASWPKDKGMEIDGAVADQFGDERYIKNALESMKSINLIQRPKGESNIGVAAASIIARDCFEKRMAQLGHQFGMKFPFGVSPKVIATAHQFVKQYGKARMHEVAKIHFKTYREIAE